MDSTPAICAVVMWLSALCFFVVGKAQTAKDVMLLAIGATLYCLGYYAFWVLKGRR